MHFSILSLVNHFFKMSLSSFLHFYRPLVASVFRNNCLENVNGFQRLFDVLDHPVSSNGGTASTAACCLDDAKILIWKVSPYSRPSHEWTRVRTNGACAIWRALCGAYNSKRVRFEVTSDERQAMSEGQPVRTNNRWSERSDSFAGRLSTSGRRRVAAV